MNTYRVTGYHPDSATKANVAGGLYSEGLAEKVLVAAISAGWCDLEIVLEPEPAPQLSDVEKYMIENAPRYPDGSRDRIPAIKAVRIRTGLGLKEAKDLVDAYIATLGSP